MNRDAASTILFYSPVTRPTEACMCCNLAAIDSSCKIGSTKEAVLTLTLLDHPYNAMSLTYMWMCVKGEILGAKSRICIISSPRLSSFIVTSPVGFEEDTIRAWVVREKGERQTKYWPSGSWHTPPIPDPDVLVFPIHVGGERSNLQRWLGVLARLRTNSRQASILSCMYVVGCKCLPATL